MKTPTQDQFLDAVADNLPELIITIKSRKEIESLYKAVCFLFGTKPIEDEKIVEEKFPFSFAYLNGRIDWMRLHKLIGVDYYKQSMVEDNEIFYLTDSQLNSIEL